MAKNHRKIWAPPQLSHQGYVNYIHNEKLLHTWQEDENQNFRFCKNIEQVKLSYTIGQSINLCKHFVEPNGLVNPFLGISPVELSTHVLQMTCAGMHQYS